MTVPQAFLVFDDLDILKSFGQLLSRMSLKLDLSGVFSKLDGCEAFFTGNTPKMMLHNQFIMSGVRDICMSYCFNVNIDHLVKVVSIIFLYCKVPFPFVINKYLGGDTLILCKYPVSPTGTSNSNPIRQVSF